MIELKHTGEWCIVNYDNEGYPGVIMDAEGHTVKVMALTSSSGQVPGRTSVGTMMSKYFA